MSSRPESRAASPGRRSFLFSGAAGPSTPKTTPLSRAGSSDQAAPKGRSDPGVFGRLTGTRPQSATPLRSNRAKSLQADRSKHGEGTIPC
jgi:hypothetical protein